jgi:release factor H-coupled RctB family protein
MLAYPQPSPPNRVTPTVDIVSGDGVWIPDDAVVQLEKGTALPGCVAAVGMPDLHAGPGLPIGAVMVFDKLVYPGLVGSDVGCGARLVVTTDRGAQLDHLERRLLAEFSDEDPTWNEYGDLLTGVAKKGIPSLADVAELPRALRALAEDEPQAPSLDIAHAALEPLDLRSDLWQASLGTIGLGNHFAEVGRVRKVHDPVRAAMLGVQQGAVTVLAHTGSRGVGKRIGDHFGHGALQGEGAASYLTAHDWACRFARMNRLFLTWRLLSAVGVARKSKIATTVDCAHNQVVASMRQGHPVWVHRKGAAPALDGELTILLGSRGASSWLLIGNGSQRTFGSVAHGAGRRYSRADAHAKMKAKYERKSLRRTALGGRVICDRTELLYEEHPDAYKPVEPIVHAIVAAGIATPVAEIEPLVTIKQ